MLKLVSDENFNGDNLAWAAAEGRVLLTHDRDTMLEHAFQRVTAGEAMPGVFLVSNRMPIGQAIDEIPARG